MLVGTGYSPNGIVALVGAVGFVRDVVGLAEVQCLVVSLAVRWVVAHGLHANFFARVDHLFGVGAVVRLRQRYNLELVTVRALAVLGPKADLSQAFPMMYAHPSL